MDFSQICRLLGRISLLIGCAMALSLPWTFPAFGRVEAFDARAAFGLLGSMGVCAAVGLVLARVGRQADHDRLHRKEAMAVVGLSWILATALGALPYWLSGTAVGRDAEGVPLTMGIVDGLFESASGFTGTGATIIMDLEDPRLVPPAILFWRSETHFLGGLGIMVLFVAILGFGSAGKALLRSEMPGPPQDTPYSSSRQTARAFALIFIGLTLVLTLLLIAQGMSLFDGLCHAFGTIATGGFSTYNRSVGHFNNPGIEITIVVFMVIACTNFTLLYYVILQRPGKLFGDIEFRTYIAILLLATAGVCLFGLARGDFASTGQALRESVFQTTSIMTNTGFGTADFDRWCAFSRATLLLLMFIGGCAGSTSCSIKVIRHIFLFKSLKIEVEKAFRPNLVRRPHVGGQVLDENVIKEVLVYFALFGLIVTLGWFALATLEPDSTWTASDSRHEKLIDCFSAVAATINGVGPGLGVVGATQNYHVFQPSSKLVLTSLMLLGRLELFVVIVLFVPRFWRPH